MKNLCVDVREVKSNPLEWRVRHESFVPMQLSPVYAKHHAAVQGSNHLLQGIGASVNPEEQFDPAVRVVQCAACCSVSTPQAPPHSSST
jgi:hypothetical protein